MSRASKLRIQADRPFTGWVRDAVVLTPELARDLATQLEVAATSPPDHVALARALRAMGLMEEPLPGVSIEAFAEWTVAAWQAEEIYAVPGGGVQVTSRPDRIHIAIKTEWPLTREEVQAIYEALEAARLETGRALAYRWGAAVQRFLRRHRFEWPP